MTNEELENELNAFNMRFNMSTTDDKENKE